MRCGMYCEDHLPKNKKCEECGGELSFNKTLTKKINENYKIKCKNCGDKEEAIYLKDLDAHLQESCWIKCIQKCGENYKPKDQKTHLDLDCINTIISCIGCGKKDPRGLIGIHQEDCIKAQIFLIQQNTYQQQQQIDQQNQTILQLQQQNELLIQLNEQNKNLIQQKTHQQQQQIDQQNQTILQLQQQNENLIQQKEKDDQKIGILEQNNQNLSLKISSLERLSPFIEKMLKEEKEKEIEKQEKIRIFNSDERSIKGMFSSFCPFKEMEILKNYLIESKLITENHGGYLPLLLLYRASVDGFSSFDFHRKCDGKKKILVLIKARDYIFGGYSSECFTSRSKKKGTGGTVFSEETFIFSLSNPENRPTKFISINPKESIFDGSYYGPCFGEGGADILIKSDSNQNDESFSNLGKTYEGKK